MEELNRTLQRQIRKHLQEASEEVPEDLKDFVEAINDSFNHYEKDRKLLERTLTLNSEELEAANEDLFRWAQDLEKRVHERTLELEQALKGAEPLVKPRRAFWRI